MSVIYLVVIFGLLQNHVFIHVDNRHHAAHPVGLVRARPMKNPAGVKADLAQIEWLDDVLEIRDAQFLLNNCLAVVADGQFAALHEDVAARAKFQRLHVERNGLQRNPDRDGLVRGQWPVVLIGVPGRDAATVFFIQGLVVVQTYTVGLHQVGGDFAEALAEHEVPDAVVRSPKIENLQKCLTIRSTCVQCLNIGTEVRHFLADQLAIIGQRVAIKYVS